MLQQKHGENVRKCGLCIDKLAMKLYHSMVEDREHMNEQKKTILNTVTRPKIYYRISRK